MSNRRSSILLKLISAFGFLPILAAPMLASAQEDQITFHRDIEPILQRSCQNCHRAGGVGPMPLVTYEQVAPFAGLIEYKTGLRDRAGAMPPWYMEKDIGIQNYKNDPSLSDEEIADISTWARSGAPKGNAANAPQMDISFSVGPEGILLDKAGSYTVKFQDNTTGGPALQLNLQDASATSLATLNSGNAHTLSAPPQLRSAVIVSRTLATAGDLITGLNTFIVG